MLIFTSNRFSRNSNNFFRNRPSLHVLYEVLMVSGLMSNALALSPITPKFPSGNIVLHWRNSHCSVTNRRYFECGSYRSIHFGGIDGSLFSKKAYSTAASSGRVDGFDSIISTKSSTVKLIRALKKKRKKREEEQLTVLEGHRLVLDALTDENTAQLIRHVIVSERALDHDVYGEKLKELLRARSGEIVVNVGSDEVTDACCDTVTPQGIIAMCTIPPEFNPTKDLDDRTSPIYLIFDGVSDPGNVGTLLRSAAAVGVAGVFVLPNSCDVFGPKAVRSAMGATFKVPVRSVSSVDECIEVLAECGVTSQNIFAATMDTSDGASIDASSLPHYHVDWKSAPSALCLGQEGSGLSDTIRHYVARGRINSVHVPMMPGVESLNAAVCGSVIMFEHFRQSGDNLASR